MLPKDPQDHSHEDREAQIHPWGVFLNQKGHSFLEAAISFPIGGWMIRAPYRDPHLGRSAKRLQPKPSNLLFTGPQRSALYKVSQTSSFVALDTT